MRRIVTIFFSLLFLLCGVLFVFRHQCVTFGVRAVLNKAFSDTFVCKDITAREGKIFIQGMSVQEKQMTVSMDQVECGIDLTEILSHPKRLIDFYRHGFSSWPQMLVLMKQYGLDLDIHAGILELDEKRYYFQFKNGEKRHEIGTLSISHDPGLMEHPFLAVQLCMRGDQLLTNISIEEVRSEQLLHLAAAAFPQHLQGFRDAQGHVQLRASMIFEENGKVDELSTRFTCQNFEVHHPNSQLAIQMKKLSGDLSYPEGVEDVQLPLWKKMQCELALEQGNFLLGNQLALSNLEGSVALDPREDPALNLKGELVGEEKPLALQLVGKGAIHEDRAYWLEFVLNLNDRLGTECGAFLSICRPEAESLVVQLEASHLLPTQVEMLKGYLARSLPRLNNWEIQQGDFGGKLIALFEKGNLSHFEVQDLIGEKVALSSKQQEPLFFSKIEGSGRLFEALNFTIDLPAAQFFSFISPDLKSAYSSYRPDDIAHLSMTVAFQNNQVETSANVDFLGLEESLQFGFISTRPFPPSLELIQEGWARSEKISHMLYGPFIRLADEDLKLYGDIDLVAAYDGKKVNFSLQVENFLSKHPILDIKASAIGEKGKTEGRAKLIYDPIAHTVEGTLPLRSGKVYERQYGLYFHDADVDFAFGPKHFGAQVLQTNVSFDQQPLLKKARFSLAYDEKPFVSGLEADLALATDKQLRLSAAKISSSDLDVRLFDGKQELAHFVGQREKQLQGSLTLPTYKTPLDVQFEWDPLTDLALLAMEGEGVQLLCKKQGKELVVEKCLIGETRYSGAISKNEEGFAVSNFKMVRDELSLDGMGTFSLSLPQTDQTFSIQGELNVDAEIQKSFPLKLKGIHPIKLGYSPDLGLVLSGLDFEGDGTHLSVEHAQYSNPTGKVTANRCAFSLSEKVLATLFTSKALPELLCDFQVCKGLSGTVNYSLEKGVSLATGTLYSKMGDLNLNLEWKDQAGEFSLGEEGEPSQLTFRTHLTSEGFGFDAIQGSLRRLTADLKKLGKDRLKGKISLDFSLFDQLFDLPINSYLSLWKTGGGYEFDGIFTPQKRLADWKFKGKVTGKSFTCAGYAFRSLEGNIAIESGQISIENLDLSDEAGKLWIGEGALMRSGDANDWRFVFPSVELRGFQPFSLHKLDDKAPSSHPLMIKSATLENVQGWLDDPSSITANGALRFVNTLSGEEKYLPQETLERMGLDGALFIPESGELKLAIQNGRCYLRELQSVISEKRRSEFQPPRSGVMGYMDFAGNLFIDLQVKQNVDRNRSAPLSFKLRGTLHDPQVIIK